MFLGKKSSLVFITGVILFVSSNSVLAWVKNISLERVFVGDTLRVHEVEVRCRIEKKTRTLRKVVSENSPWCSVDVPSMCSKAKIAAARELCKLSASEYKAIVEETAIAAATGDSVPKPVESEASGEAVIDQSNNKASASEAVNSTNSDSRDELKAEQLLIEEQRIEIEQRRIELTRREVSLRKELNQIPQP